MGTGHANALGMGTADVAQHNAALNGLDAAGAGGLQLGVVVVDGGAVHDQIGVADIGGIVADGDAHAQGTLGLGVLGLLNVRAGDGVAAAVQNLDQRMKKEKNLSGKPEEPSLKRSKDLQLIWMK